MGQRGKKRGAKYWLLAVLIILLPSAIAVNVSIFTPVNNTVTNSSTIDVTADFDINLSIASWSVNTTNASNGQQFLLCINTSSKTRTQANCLADFTNMTDGIYNLTGRQQNRQDNSVDGNTTYNITIDRTLPNIVLGDPVNVSTFYPGKVNFRFTPTDNLDILLQCDLFVDGENTTTVNVSNSTQSAAYGVNVLDLGTHTWYVSCTDNANNANISSTFNFRTVSSGSAGGGGGGRRAQSHPVRQSSTFTKLSSSYRWRTPIGIYSSLRGNRTSALICPSRWPISVCRRTVRRAIR